MLNKEQNEQEQKIKEKLLNEMNAWDASSDRYSVALDNYTKFESMERQRDKDKKDRIEKNEFYEYDVHHENYYGPYSRRLHQCEGNRKHTHGVL